MPKIVQHGVRGELPPLVDPHISRDFVYIDDVVEAFVAAASELREDDYGESFNVGTGRQTTIGELAEVARELYGIEQPAELHHAPRRWDVSDWYANSARARKVLGWEARTPLEDGLERMTSWYRGLPDPSATAARPRRSRSTPSTASRPSSPATATPRRSRSCTGG